MGTKGKSKDPENISSAHAASGSSLENNFRPQIAQIFFPLMNLSSWSAAAFGCGDLAITISLHSSKQSTGPKPYAGKEG